ncbi:MAG: 2-hydroxychromene-2-carboxylate isomerase [Pseudomonadota bacterium]
MPRLTFWFEFASTYSYLSAMRIEGLALAHGVEIAWRPFLLGPIFTAQGWETSPFNIYPAKGRYMWRDMDRLAKARGLPPVRRPEPFPQNGLLAARLATIGTEQSWGPDFVRAVYAAEFAEGRDISDPAVLADCLANSAAQGTDLLQRARVDQTIKDRLRAATTEAAQLGVFGAPSFVTEDGEIFWGDDRLDAAIDWASSHAV